jgi:hypothetical protein
MSISSCFNKTVLSGLYIYIYYNISKCTLCTHVFNRESASRSYVKGQTAGKGKNKLYKTIESK